MPANRPKPPTTEPIDQSKIAAVRAHLLDWFERNRRDLPWRHTRDPYRILVSEVMLQQTQVDRVVPYFERFLERFPTVEALAAAPTADVIQAWAGLGYNRRAVNLQRTANAVVERFGGSFPSDPVDLAQLPGIGPYTAGAIACFAFERDAAFIDTNMRRVIHRVFFGVDVPESIASDKEVLSLAAELVPPGDGWRWNQGLIEFGALQCTARRPACVICPLQRACAAYPAIQSAISSLPPGVRLKKEAPFAGSNRFYRGRALAALREHARETPHNAGIPLSRLGTTLREDYPHGEHGAWLIELVHGMQRDGLALVAEDTPGYDAEPTVRLPE